MIVLVLLFDEQVGVQCEVQPEAGASALEDKVNAVLPLQTKEGEEGTDQPDSGTAPPTTSS